MKLTTARLIVFVLAGVIVLCLMGIVGLASFELLTDPVAQLLGGVANVAVGAIAGALVQRQLGDRGE